MTDGNWEDALERAHRNAPWEEWIHRDPISLVRAYDAPNDQEVAGFIAASLAYGRVSGILASVKRALAVMAPSPAVFVDAFNPASDGALFDGFAHRFHGPASMVAMVDALRVVRARHGSLGAAFMAHHAADAPNTAGALAGFVGELRDHTRAVHGAAWAARADLYGWRHTLASPDDGSACKRLHLFLRWMVRSGSPDVGAWKGVTPDRLLMPVDVHVARLARAIGLTHRASPCQRMAEEITDALRAVDPRDPVRFDFVLSHLGMDGADAFVTGN